MRPAVLPLLLLAGCTGGANHLGNSLFWPVTGVATTIEDGTYSRRRGAVELIVKSGYPMIVDDIRAGGGPTLTQAMDAAGIPGSDRPARILQLHGDLAIYDSNPGALVTALMVYGS